ncbi:MAG TPA: DNA polymerase III subunit delta', partial [Elusimicrobiales bacterium]|nr:DNA polymerase III subunit delta' [Elusimicrobiales bacterium]
LRAMLAADRLPSALLFRGPAGTGKRMAALELAVAANCQSPAFDGAPCRECESCRQITQGTHPDFMLLGLETQAEFFRKTGEDEAALKKQEHIRVEPVRSMCDSALRTAVSARHRFFIIDDAQTMVPAAANALLKLLEEPPQQLTWILLSTSPESMLATIRSRCQMLEFRPLSEEALEQALLGQSLSLEEARKLAPSACGSVERALKIKKLLEEFADLDTLSPIFPMQAAKALPKDTKEARASASLALELLIATAERRWRAETGKQKRHALVGGISRLFAYKKYIGRNVAPALVLETALLELEPLKLDFSIR